MQVIQVLRDCFDGYISSEQLEDSTVKRLSDNSMWLLGQRYFVPRYDSRIKDIRKECMFEELARRVSRIVTSAESQYCNSDIAEDLDWMRTLEKNIANDILNKRFLFNSPCLFSAGAGLTVQPEFADLIYKNPDSMTYQDYEKVYKNKTRNQQLFACFVINIPDSLDGIFDSVKDASIISKFGGGVGANFGHLREQGSPISGGAGGQSSGPVSFMETWDTMGSVVVQGGKRRAALMGMLFDDHPDIEQFINCKTEDGRLPYFNISVAISDKLMSSASFDKDFYLYSRADGHTVKTVKARDLMNKICENAWKRGDPGIFFIDRARQDNLLKMSEEWEIESTNPCGEQPLPNYTSCNLGSINVEAFVHHGEFDVQEFNRQVMRSMYYLDLVIDACSYPLPKIEERTKKIRPVGLGVMGLANAAILQNIVYGSDEFKDFCEVVASNLSVSALVESVQAVYDFKNPFEESHLVEKLFDSFRDNLESNELAGLLDNPSSLNEYNFKVLIDAMKSSEIIPHTLTNTLSLLFKSVNFADTVLIFDCIRHGRLRNSRRLSIAPTGSISMILDTSSSIEPNFAWSWKRRITRTNGEGFEEIEFWHNLLSEDQKKEYSNLGKISDPVFVSAYDISTQQHVDVVGIFAKVIDSAISKTVNLPDTATVDDVQKVYQTCYSLGCKGITIYRNGSRSQQPIEVKKVNVPVPMKIKDRPGTVVFGKTIKDKTPFGSVYVTLNFDGTDPFEVFINVGKSGSEMKAMTEALSRVISIGMRSGCSLESFIDTLKGLSGKEYWMFECDDEHVVRSIPDAIALLLEKLIDRKPSIDPEKGGLVCPECNSPLEIVSGCVYCFSCGYSPCK